MDITGVGDFLKATRKNKRLTQGQVAEQLGVSAQAVSKWERGENLPDIAFFPDLARLYDVDVNEIFAAGQLAVKRNSFEEDLKKIQHRLDDVIKGLFAPSNRAASLGYESILEDILPYTNGSQRTDIMRRILTNRDYENIEILIPYLSMNMKTEMLEELLSKAAYEAIEDIMPIFARRQRDLIVLHFLENQPGPDLIDNFLPFFDKNQLRRINHERE